MRILLGLFFIIATCFNLSAQEQQKLIKITGRVIAVKDTSGISYANVLNLSYPSGTISDQVGNFTIVCRYGDTLQFSCLGYDHSYLNTKNLDATNIEHNVRIRLMSKIYQLPTVTIFPFSTRAGLKRAFLAMKLPEKDIMEMAVAKRLKVSRYDVGAFPSSGLTLPGPVSLLYDLFSKEGKNRRKFEKILQQESIDKLIDRRYNADIVARIIGNDDPNLVKDFMKYCHFSIGYISLVNDYDLYLNIKQSWLNYAYERHIK